MGEKTKIEWCDHTFNPWRGCQKVSPGCQNCYAEKQAKRNPSVLGIWGLHGTRVIASDAAWKQPLAWNRKAAREGIRRRVFCGSMCDVFEDRPELTKPRLRLFDTISATPDLDWLLLTKRPENVLRLSAVHIWEDQENALDPIMLPNVWVGTSVENQEMADKRIPELLKIPAQVRFLSCEPLLGQVNLDLFMRCPECGYTLGDVGFHMDHHLCNGPGPGIHWIIEGGESGPHARPCDVAWIRSLIRQCKVSGVPAFIKQLGANVFDAGTTSATHFEPEQCWPEGTEVDFHTIKLRHPKGGDPAEWPSDLRVQEWPEVAGSQQGKERDDD